MEGTVPAVLASRYRGDFAASVADPDRMRGLPRRLGFSPPSLYVKLGLLRSGDTCISLLTASGTTLTTALSDILGDKVQLGLEPAIRIVGKTRAARLINTHDEPKRAQGLISYLSTIQPLGGLTVRQALRVKRGDPDDQRQQAAQLILNEHVKMGQYRANADATPFKPTALAVPAGSVLDLA